MDWVRICTNPCSLIGVCDAAEHKAVEVVGLRLVDEGEVVGLAGHNRLAIANDGGAHALPDLERQREPRGSGISLERLTIGVGSGKDDRCRSGEEEIGPEFVLYQFPVGWFSNVIAGSRRVFGMRACCEDDSVVLDLRELPSLERLGVVGGQRDVVGVRKSIDPSVRLRLVGADLPDVGRLAIVVPCNNLGEVDLVAVLDKRIPARTVKVIVRDVEPVLVVRVGTDSREGRMSDGSSV